MRKTDGGRIGVESDDEGSIVSNRLFIKVQIETPERIGNEPDQPTSFLSTH